MVVVVISSRKVPRRRIRQPKDQATRYIPLTLGQKALVDAEDYDWLMRWNWYAKWDEDTQSYYARRSTRAMDGVEASQIGMHNQVLGAFGGVIVDHANGDTLDMRKANLRRASSGQNSFNHPTRRDNQLGVKGVRMNRSGSYEVRICVDGVRKSQTFSTLDEARQAREAAEREAHGEFRRVAA